MEILGTRSRTPPNAGLPTPVGLLKLIRVKFHNEDVSSIVNRVSRVADVFVPPLKSHPVVILDVTHPQIPNAVPSPVGGFAAPLPRAGSNPAIGGTPLQPRPQATDFGFPRSALGFSPAFSAGLKFTRPSAGSRLLGEYLLSWRARAGTPRFQIAECGWSAPGTRDRGRPGKSLKEYAGAP